MVSWPSIADAGQAGQTLSQEQEAGGQLSYRRPGVTQIYTHAPVTNLLVAAKKEKGGCGVSLLITYISATCILYLTLI